VNIAVALDTISRDIMNRFSKFFPDVLRPLCAIACWLFLIRAAGADVSWICSTESQPWQTMLAPVLAAASPATPPEIRVAADKTAQTIDGFGGCFNELGWLALGKASEADRQRVLSALFGDDGCAFTLGRIPVGASDFATNGYSLDDMPGDFELKHFSIARDEQILLPYIKAAMAVRPSLQCWASPWSPPAWMKTNDSYSKGALRWEPAMLHSYANYFVRWIESYRAAGINLYAITPQNEPNILNVYPTCLWTGPQLREFIADYLGPTLRDRKTNVELWLGLNGDPLNGGDNINDRLITVMEDAAAAKFITGVAFQYDSRNQIATASQLFPGKKFMQSETECNGGANSWADAQKLFGLMKRYFDGGANAYFMWNMVLDETGLSTWKWRQNTMITVDQKTGGVTYNGEYYVMRHFSQFVKPGAKRVLTTGAWGDKIGFINPDGSVVLVIGNSSNQSFEVSAAIAGCANGGTLKVKLPARSINTFVVPAAK
jgi:glucosylceramidase